MPRRKTPKLPGPGRPTRLNATVATNLVSAIGGGNYIRTACQFAGIGHATFTQWRRRADVEIDRLTALGHDAEEIYALAESSEQVEENGTVVTKKHSIRELFDMCPEPFDPVEWPFVILTMQVEKAQATAEVRALTLIQQAGSDQWQAAAWYLERTRPERFGRRDRVNVEGPQVGGPLEVQVSVESLESKIAGMLGDDEK